jgi:pyruvate dehydrogenase E1 component alpha subunit
MPTGTPGSQPLAPSRDDGSVDPAHAAALSDELAVAIYEQMVFAREADLRLVALQREGRVTQHATAVGEEAAVLGAVAAMRDEDWIFLDSREVAAAFWRGMPLANCMHDAFGTGRGAGRGRDAPGAPFWKPARVVSRSALVGTQISHAVGVAWAARMRRQDVAALVFFGEGATSGADFHTGLNFAGVMRAPLVAVCRNNGWATSTPASRQTASAGFAVKAIAYGLRGMCVDGGDIAAVLSVAREARARAAAGEGGTLIEAVTAPPREGESPEAWSRRDPIARLRRHIDARNLWGDDREQRLYAEVRADLQRAVAEAEKAGVAERETMFDDVYSELPWHLREQRDGLQPTAGAWKR